MDKILFLEVDAQDAPEVVKQFPGATIIDRPLKEQQLVDACKGHSVVSCFIYSAFNDEVLAKLPDLKLLCTRSVGYNHIDLDACKKRGIRVCNVPDYGSHVIAEHAFALLLSSLRHVPEAGAQVKSGNFDYHGLRGMALMGKTIGIVGTGKIGRAVARIAHGFGMRILAVDMCRVVELESQLGVRYTDLPDLLREADIVSLHLPALPETVHMMDAGHIAMMKDGAVLVNTARGELIDSVALLQALKSGKLSWALLDVLEHEKDFQWNKELISHPHVVVTPHIAFYADDSMRAMYQDSFRSIRAWQDGEKLLHQVQPVTLVCDRKGVTRRT